VIDTERLNYVVKTNFEFFCRHFFPEGRRVGDEWKIGDISGAPGESLGIQLTGQKAGLYHDWATGEGGDFVKLLRENRNINFIAAVEEIERAIGLSLRSVDQHSCTTYDYQRSNKSEREKSKKPSRLALDCIEACNSQDLLQLSKLRTIPLEGLRIATQRKLLFAHDYPYEGRCWVVTDDARRNAICRRLDGKRFRKPSDRKKEPPKSKCWYGSNANWPIGIAQANGFPAIALCEGVPDFLAASYLAWAGGVEYLVAPVCMTGASCKIEEDALPLFRGRRVRIFGDADEAGQLATTK
jgi:hypothetical protein